MTHLRNTRIWTNVAAAAVLVAVGVGAASASTLHRRTVESVPRMTASASILRVAPAFPLKVSKNRRYLVDRRNRPFLLIGDSPQA